MSTNSITGEQVVFTDIYAWRTRCFAAAAESMSRREACYICMEAGVIEEFLGMFNVSAGCIPTNPDTSHGDDNWQTDFASTASLIKVAGNHTRNRRLCLSINQPSWYAHTERNLQMVLYWNVCAQSAGNREQRWCHSLVTDWLKVNLYTNQGVAFSCVIRDDLCHYEICAEPQDHQGQTITKSLTPCTSIFSGSNSQHASRETSHSLSYSQWSTTDL